jgi:hypothetical protein
MGDRGQVFIKDTGVYLYTHWGASELCDVVQDAMKRKQRWNDPEYLTRIIFSEMIKKEIDEETGYGIGSSKHGDIWRLITINCESQTIKVSDNNGATRKWSFDEFINVDFGQEV